MARQLTDVERAQKQAALREWRRANKERVNEQQKAYRAANRHRARQWQNNRRNLRRAWLEEQKAAGCSRCPEKFPACLDFHHLDPATKRFMIGPSVLNHTLEDLEAEMAKCIILCANCHRKEHARLKADA